MIQRSTMPGIARATPTAISAISSEGLFQVVLHSSFANWRLVTGTRTRREVYGDQNLVRILLCRALFGPTSRSVGLTVYSICEFLGVESGASQSGDWTGSMIKVGQLGSQPGYCALFRVLVFCSFVFKKRIQLLNLYAVRSCLLFVPLIKTQERLVGTPRGLACLAPNNPMNRLRLCLPFLRTELSLWQKLWL